MKKKFSCLFYFLAVIFLLLVLPVLIYLIPCIIHDCRESEKLKKLYPFVAESVGDVSGEWRLYDLDEPLNLMVPYSVFPDNRLYSINQLRYYRADLNIPYRIHISKLAIMNLYNFNITKYHDNLFWAFDISDGFQILELSTCVLKRGGGYLNELRRDGNIPCSVSMDFWKTKDEPQIFINESGIELALVVKRDINFSFKENLVLYEELDSVKAQDVTVLSLAGLDFENIPQKLKNFPQIKKLFMPFNKVKFTDADFEILESLPNLEVLDIRGNDIANSPDPNLTRLKNLKSLKKLYIGGKDVLHDGKFPNGIFEIRSLETLSMGQLGTIELPEEIANLKNLKALRIYSSKLKTLPPESMRAITWYYYCFFDSSLPNRTLPNYSHDTFKNIRMHVK